MNNEKLAEALRRTCRKMKTFSRTGVLDGAVAVWVDEIESAIAAHATETTQAQAQSGEWVMVPREPTKAMIEASCKIKLGRLEALRDGHGASSGIVSAVREEWEAMLAAATQPQTERLAETLPSDDWFANEICEARNHWHEHHEANWLETDDNHPDDFMGKWLRSKLLAAHDTHPQPAQDASKYQELLMAVEKKFPGESRHETALRYIREAEYKSPESKCDAAMAKESER